MIDFYIILIQWADVLLERRVMDLDVQEWALITGRGEAGSFPLGSYRDAADCVTLGVSTS